MRPDPRSSRKAGLRAIRASLSSCRAAPPLWMRAVRRSPQPPQERTSPPPPRARGPAGSSCPRPRPCPRGRPPRGPRRRRRAGRTGRRSGAAAAAAAAAAVRAAAAASRAGAPGPRAAPPVVRGRQPHGAPLRLGLRRVAVGETFRPTLALLKVSSVTRCFRTCMCFCFSRWLSGCRARPARAWSPGTEPSRPPAPPGHARRVLSTPAWELRATAWTPQRGTEARSSGGARVTARRTVQMDAFQQNGMFWSCADPRAAVRGLLSTRRWFFTLFQLI